MEDMSLIMNAISTVGFPIVISLVLMYVVYKMNEQHKCEIDELRKTIENNTLAITRLVDKMGC